MSTVPYIPDDNVASRVSRTRRFDEFTADELSHLAAKALLPERLVLDAAHETVAPFHQHWQSEKKNLPLSSAAVLAVETHLKGPHRLIPATRQSILPLTGSAMLATRCPSRCGLVRFQAVSIKAREEAERVRGELGQGFSAPSLNGERGSLFVLPCPHLAPRKGFPGRRPDAQKPEA